MTFVQAVEDVEVSQNISTVSNNRVKCSRNSETGKGLAETCLKCSKLIEHVPYKYMGYSFHSLCLVCNFCGFFCCFCCFCCEVGNCTKCAAGKKLIAKPLTIVGTKIFCSEHCKNNLEGTDGVTIKLMSTQLKFKNPARTKKTEAKAKGEYLIAVIENIKERSMDNMELKKKPLPVKNQRHDPDRITDYPQVRSTETILSRYHSLSARSEGNVTSNGSVILHDARKKPKKNILKDPKHMRKNSQNHVRWNLPEKCEFETDISSVASIESSSTSYKVKGQLDFSDMTCASKGALKVQPSVNPELTQGKDSHHHCHNPHLHLDHRQAHRDFTQSASCICSISSSSTSFPAHSFLLGGSVVHSNHASMHPSHSFSASSLPPSAVNGEATTVSASISPHASSTITLPNSIPKQHLQSNPISISHDKKSVSGRRKSNDNTNEDSFISDANLTIRSHSKMKRSNTAPAGKRFFIDNVDACDYDHLNPLKNDISTTSTLANRKDEKNDERKLKENFDRVLVSLKTNSDVNLEEDIDNPLPLLASESRDTHNLAASPLTENPPPIPPKTRRLRDKDMGQHAAVKHKEFAAKETEKDKSILLPLPAKSNEEKKPPPLPPKLARRRHQDSDYTDKPLKDSKRFSHLSSQSIEDSSTESSDIPPRPINSKKFMAVDTVPPPSEFSDMGFNSNSNSHICRIGSLPKDNALARKSNCKLIPNLDQLQERKDFSGTKHLCGDVVTRFHQNNSSRMVHANKMKGEVGAKTDGAPAFDARHIAEHHARSSGIMTEQLLHHQDGVISSDKRSLLSTPISKHDSGEEGMASENDDPWKSGTEISIMEGNTYRHLPPSNIPLNSPSIKISHHTDQSCNTRDNWSNPRNQSLAIHSSPNCLLPPLLFTHDQKMGDKLTKKTSNKLMQKMCDKLTQKMRERLAEEEQCASNHIYPTNRKLPVINSTVHDTGKHIQEMETLAKINITGTRNQRANTTAFGLCGKCGKSIVSQKDLWSHDGLCYHIRCFQCARCSISLQGRTAFRVKTTILCSICHTNYNSSSLHSGASHKQHQTKHQLHNHGSLTGEYHGLQSDGHHPPPTNSHHATPTGGQITFV